jgi:hypothetical protein
LTLRTSNKSAERLQRCETKCRWTGYFDINDYHSWTGRTVTGELKRTPGIDVAHWNRWLDSRGGEGCTEIAGVRMRNLKAPFTCGDFVVYEDEIELARRSEARWLVLEKVHGWRSVVPRVLQVEAWSAKA